LYISPLKRILIEMMYDIEYIYPGHPADIRSVPFMAYLPNRRYLYPRIGESCLEGSLKFTFRWKREGKNGSSCRS
jgi:hypothetical protein